LFKNKKIILILSNHMIFYSHSQLSPLLVDHWITSSLMLFQVLKNLEKKRKWIQKRRKEVVLNMVLN